MLPAPRNPARMADLAQLAGLIAGEIEIRKQWDYRTEEEIGNTVLKEIGVVSFRPQVYTLRLLQRFRQVGKAPKPRLFGVVVAMRGGGFL